jgi:hypothetical protein
LFVSLESDSVPVGNDLRWEQATQPLPEIEFDQCLAW